MAAGAAAAAERGLLRLLQRLDAEKEKREKREKGQNGEGEEDGENLRKDREKDEEVELRRYLAAELQELGAVWSKSESSQSSQLVRSLGCHLEELSLGLCARAVRAFAPLQEDVRRQMVTLTAKFNDWLGDALPDTSTLAEKTEVIEEHLKVLDGATYLPCCYRWVGFADVRVKFLVALALVLRTLLGTEVAKLTELAERLLLRFFGLEKDEAAKAAKARERCFAWLEGRLCRYDREWRRAAERAKAAGFAGELRRRLGRALEASSGGGWLELPKWPMAYCSAAKALGSFLVDYNSPGSMWPDCPAHSLQPAALLAVLNELLDPFEIDEARGGEGGICLNETWETIKSEQDAAPPAREAEASSPSQPKASAPSVPQKPSPAQAILADTPKQPSAPPGPETPQKPPSSPEPADAKSQPQPQPAPKQKRSRSRSRRSSSAESLQPKLLKSKKEKLSKDKESPKDSSKDPQPKPEEAEVPASPKKAKAKRSHSSSSEAPNPKQVAKKAAPAAPPPSHAPPGGGGPPGPGQYFYPMPGPWGPHPMAMPGMMPHPGHRPGLPLMWHMPGMPIAVPVEKRKKDKHKKEKHKKEKDRDRDRDETGSESTREKKRRKKKEKEREKEKEKEKEKDKEKDKEKEKSKKEKKEKNK